MRLLLILAMLIGSSNVPAGAQRRTEAETGSLVPVPRRARIADTSTLSDKDRGRVTMAAFARCTVDRHNSQVATALSLPAHELAAASLARLADDECLDAGQMRFQSVPFRGALFVELYRRRAEAEARHSAWRLPVVPFNAQQSIELTNQQAAEQVALLAFAACVAERDPAGAKAVVMGPTVSKVQDAAIASLVPHLGPCLPSGQKITLGKIVLEGALGEVLYRGLAPSVRPASKEAE